MSKNLLFLRCVAAFLMIGAMCVFSPSCFADLSGPGSPPPPPPGSKGS